MASEGGRTWRTWHLVAVAGVALIIGLAAGAGSSTGESDARKQAEQKLASAEALNEDLNTKIGAERATSDALRRATSTIPPTTLAPPTTVAPTTTTAPGPKTTFSDGSYRVGVDIAPGTYRSSGTGSDCYWQRLSNFTGSGNILANYLSNSPTTVTILPGDAGFESRRCGTWTKV